MYLDAEDRILSNNSMLECYSIVVRGISKEDIENDYFKYCTYLNSIYVLNLYLANKL